MRAELAHTFRFEAAHFLPRVPDEHPCSRIHGHSYVVIVTVEGDVDPYAGWVMDFGHLAEAVATPLAELDHQLLNDIPGLENPTSEVLAAWLWTRLVSHLPSLHSIEVRETVDTSCLIRGS